MTDRVEPNFGGGAKAALMAGAAAYGGGVRSSGWVVPHGSEYFATDAGLAGTPLQGFSRSTSGTSLDATINPGEGFVGGYWFGRDTASTVTLAANAASQRVYAGVNTDVTNGVIVGLAGAFGADDPRTPLWDFTTNANGVTDAVDARTQSPPETPTTRWQTVSEVTDTGSGNDLGLDTGTMSETYAMYRVWIRMEDEGGSTTGQEAKLQLNGVTNSQYSYDYFDAYNNTFVSSGGDNKFNKVCASDGDGTWGETRLTVHQPTSFYSNTPANMNNNAKVSMEMRGLSHNVDHLHYGVLRSDLTGTPIERIRVWTNGNATGAMVVEGTDFLNSL